MELAFSALFVFVLALPGVVFRGAYRGNRRSWQIPPLSKSFVEQVAESLVGAVLLHCLWACVCFWPMRWLGITMDLQAALMLILGNYGKDSEKFVHVLDAMAVQPRPWYIISYFLTLYVFSYVVGASLHRQIRKRGLDYRFAWLAFDNPWHYIFNPHAPKTVFQAEDESYQAFDATLISVVVNHKESDVIYRGLLKDHDFAADGTLHSVQLENAERRLLHPQLESGSEEKKKFHAVDGDMLIICYDEIKTFNVEYVYKQIAKKDDLEALYSWAKNS